MRTWHLALIGVGLWLFMTRKSTAGEIVQEKPALVEPVFPTIPRTEINVQPGLRVDPFVWK